MKRIRPDHPVPEELERCLMVYRLPGVTDNEYAAVFDALTRQSYDDVVLELDPSVPGRTAEERFALADGALVVFGSDGATGSPCHPRLEMVPLAGLGRGNAPETLSAAIDRNDGSVGADPEQLVGWLLERVGAGAVRRGAERRIPLAVWRSQGFQSWHDAQTRAGNRLDHADPKWVFRVAQGRVTLFWAMHVHVHVAAEGRVKDNEVVISRPDISGVVAYVRREPIERSEIVLIREFRSPAVSADGFVREIPGGSSYRPEAASEEVAVDELEQEIGLRVAPDRMRLLGTRQMVATVSTHRAHVYACELTPAELEVLRAKENVALGERAESERTYVEIRTLEELMSSNELDWANLGMVFAALGCGS